MSGSTFWKKAGLSYLQYLNVSAGAVRAGAKSVRISNISYNKTVGMDTTKGKRLWW
jgi:hypothetical protein